MSRRRMIDEAVKILDLALTDLREKATSRLSTDQFPESQETGEGVLASNK